jgi:cytidylate kinase
VTLARRAICISHATGAQGETVGRAVAEQLGFRYVDDDVIAEAAAWAELDPALVADAERRRPLAARLLGRMGDQSSAARLPTGATARALPTDADLRHLIADALRTFADAGSVVIVAHAASFALAGRDVLRVLVTATPETRAKRIGEAREIDVRKAAKVVKDEDAGRADYLKRFYGVERELPTQFDVVVNTDTLTPARAAEIVVSAAA